MSDYNLKVTLRNGRILDAIKQAGYESQAAFCRANGLHLTVVNAIIAMRTQPVSEHDGRLHKVAQDICDALCALPEDLWTDEQLWTKLPRNSWQFDIGRDQAQAISDSRSMEELFEATGALKLLEHIPERQRHVLEKRVFDEKMLHECGEEMGVCTERVRQMEKKALRTIRKQVSEGLLNP